MTAPLHTRCPQCQTVFHVTPAQLAVRDGLVRCGICANAFDASQHQVETPASAPEPEPAETVPHAMAGASDEPAAPREHTGRRRKTRGRKSPPSREERFKRSRKKPSEVGRSRRPSEEKVPPPTSDDLPLVTEFPFQTQRARTPTVVWWLGGALLLALLAAQVAYFYAPELARKAYLKPWLVLYCERIGCDIKPPRETVPIDLAQTSVAPHPDYEKALRLQAALVNRADTPQPWPLMEVSLTDSEGRVLARRHFTPAQYIGSLAPHAPLTPNVTVRVQLDVTNADDRAVGYEIRLLATTEEKKI